MTILYLIKTSLYMNVLMHISSGYHFLVVIFYYNIEYVMELN